MLTPRRKGSDYHHGELRDSAILVARDLIAKGGIQSLGIRKIAEKLNVSPASLYRHFESIEDLQLELGKRIRDELADYMVTQRNRLKINSPRLKLRTIGSAYIDFAAKNPRLFEVAFSYCPPNKRIENSDRAWEVLVQAVNELKGRQLPGIEMILWSSVHGLATLAAQGAIDKRSLERDKKEVLNGIGKILR